MALRKFPVLCGTLLLCTTICQGSGKQDIFYVQVDVKQIKNDQRNPGLNLTIADRVKRKFFHFHLYRKQDRNANVPVFMPSREGIKKSIIANRKAMHMYHDIKNNAFFYVEEIMDISRPYMTGLFASENYLYTLRSNRTKKDLIYYLVRKEHSAPSQSLAREMSGSADTIYLPVVKNQFHGRTKRQTIMYEIELFLAIDHSIYETMAKGFQDDNLTEQEANELIVEEIQTHYKLLIQGVQSRFETVRGSNYRIAVNLVGIFIAHVSYASPWTYNTTYINPGSEKLVLSSGALSEFSSWVEMNKDILPQFDHAMAFTGNNLAHKENLQTLGVASQQSMCTERSLSMIEDHGNAAYASYITAHELAHSLGAKHDGVPRTVRYNGRTSTCGSGDGFVMSPKTRATPGEDFLRTWRFSECSQLYFDFYIDHLNSVNKNCLLNIDSHSSVQSQFEHTDPSPYSPDEQCTRVHGQGSVMDRIFANKNPNDVCRSIPCTSPDRMPGTRTTLETLAMEGTKCGLDKTCQRGRCEQTGVVNWDAQLLPSYDCAFGDQPGIISSTNMTCDQLISKQPFNCYKYGESCCQSCRPYLRHQNVIPDCRFGDHAPGCDGTMCDGNKCCESCAVKTAVLQKLCTNSTPEASFKIKICPDIESRDSLIASPNTVSYHHGTVLQFSCQDGYNLDGASLIICEENGTWSDHTPSCYEGCPKLVVPQWMRLELSTGNYSFGTYARFRCLNGLVLTGEATLLCLPSSVWNSSVPTCNLTFTSSEIIHIPENTYSEKVVYQLSIGNGAALFELIGISHRGFAVSKTGSVLTDVSAQIDHEMVSEYRLHIKATLTIAPRFQATQVLRIIIDDVNEYEPKFEKSIYRFSLTAEPMEAFITEKVKAIDWDSSTKQITYTISESVSIGYSDIVNLNSSTGTITISKNSLQSSRTPTLQFTVLATDDGIPYQRTGSATVLVCIGHPCSGNIPLSYWTSVFLVLVIHLTFNQTAKI